MFLDCREAGSVRRAELVEHSQCLCEGQLASGGLEGIKSLV